MKQRWEKIAALWKGKKPGTMTGQAEGVLGVMLGGRRLVLQENDRKESDNHPDFILSLAPDDGEQQKQSTELVTLAASIAGLLLAFIIGWAVAGPNKADSCVLSQIRRHDADKNNDSYIPLNSSRCCSCKSTSAGD